MFTLVIGLATHLLVNSRIHILIVDDFMRLAPKATTITTLYMILQTPLDRHVISIKREVERFAVDVEEYLSELGIGIAA